MKVSSELWGSGRAWLALVSNIKDIYWNKQ